VHFPFPWDGAFTDGVSEGSGAHRGKRLRGVSKKDARDIQAPGGRARAGRESLRCLLRKRANSAEGAVLSAFGDVLSGYKRGAPGLGKSPVMAGGPVSRGGRWPGVPGSDAGTGAAGRSR